MMPKGSAPVTFTPKRLATRGTGQAGTRRAAEHGSLPIYPMRPVALDLGLKATAAATDPSRPSLPGITRRPCDFERMVGRHLVEVSAKAITGARNQMIDWNARKQRGCLASRSLACRERHDSSSLSRRFEKKARSRITRCTECGHSARDGLGR